MQSPNFPLALAYNDTHFVFTDKPTSTANHRSGEKLAKFRNNFFKTAVSRVTHVTEKDYLALERELISRSGQRFTLNFIVFLLL